VVVVSHPPKPDGWHPEASYHFVDDMDVVPVVFGSGKRYVGPVDGQHLLENPDVVIRGDLRYRVRR
jgi:hypothetical protein